MVEPKPVRIDIFSDLVCPWCYIGKRKLEQAVAEHGGITPVITWRAFLLNPAMPEAGMDRKTYLQRKFGDAAENVYGRIAEAGRANGICFAFDAIRRTPDSRPAHRLVLQAAATRNARTDAVIETLFEAYFRQGRDISEAALLGEIADTHGIEGPVTEAIDHQMNHDLGEADRLRIQSVPYFIIDGQWAISGAQSASAFLPLFDAALAGKYAL